MAWGELLEGTSYREVKFGVGGWRATGGEGEGPGREAALTTSQLRILVGADEETQGRVEENWRAGVLAPPLSPDKGGKKVFRNEEQRMNFKNSGMSHRQSRWCSDSYQSTPHSDHPSPSSTIPSAASKRSNLQSG